MSENKKKKIEYIPFDEWNKMLDETEKTWIPDKPVKLKNPRRVTQFARKR